LFRPLEESMSEKNDLLRSAIAEAELLKQTAITNAKLSLEEEFTPAIKSMLSRRLKAEAATTEEVETTNEELKSSGIGTKGNPGEPKTEKAKSIEWKDGTGATGPDSDAATQKPWQDVDNDKDASDIGNGDNAKSSVQKSSNIGEAVDEEIDEDLDEDFNLDEIIRELEEDILSLDEEDSEDDEEEGEGEEESEEGEESDSEASAEPSVEKTEEPTETDSDSEGSEDSEELDLGTDTKDAGEGNPVAHKEPDGDEAPAGTPDVTDLGAKGGEGEELDLDEILAEIEAEEKAADANLQQMAAETAALKAELADYRKAVDMLRGKLQEVNLFNAKLLYTNQLFRKNNLTNEQKITIVETFDRVTTPREAKLVYATLAETVVGVKPKSKKLPSSKKVVSEGFASKATGTPAKTEEKPAAIIEENAVVTRLQRLAGIIND
jgi:hypothetical protein